MKNRTCRRWSVWVGVVGVLILICGFFKAEPALASSKSRAEYQGPNLSAVVLTPQDLPTGFETLSGDELRTLESQLDIYQGFLQGASEAVIQNVAAYRSTNQLNAQVVVSGIVAPLSVVEQLLIDQQFANPDEVIQQLRDAAGGFDVTTLNGAGSIGESRLAFSMKIGAGSLSMQLDYVVARRGPVLIEVAYMYLQGGQPETSAVELARLLDERTMAIVGGPISGFRPAGPFVPELTTYIPTPLDVSTKPGVIGANLLLAALLMLPFAVAAEIFTRIFGAHEDALRRRVRFVDWVAQLQRKLDAATGSNLRRPGLQDAVKLLGVILFYGLVFSLLDRTWNPFSIKGLVLLFSMMVAYGVVGIADDIIQWRAIRSWGLQADLSVRPTNFLLAAFSTAASRVFTLIPGMMFGTPEALCTDEGQFDEMKKRSLLNISARTLIVVALGVWIPTISTAILQRSGINETVKNAVGAVEALLLVVFAVALENLFVQMLGMPGSLGQALKQRSRWGWLAGLGAVAFLFYHTLINPRGELAQAIQTANVLVFFGIAVAFMLVAFGLQLYLGRREGARPGADTPTPRIKTGLAVESRPRNVQPAASGPAQAAAISQVEKVLIVVPIAECKQCPVCGEMIKSEARLCRFCRATFSVAIKGYCTECHRVVEVNEDCKCVVCSKEPDDIRVESRLLKVPAAVPARALATESLRADAPDMKEDGNLKQCPACGQTIKAEALICRFCRARFAVHERGYCLADHTVVDVKEGKCVHCGDEAQDVHFESKLVEVTIPMVPLASPSRAPAPAIPIAAEPVTAAVSPVSAARTPLWRIYLSPKGRIGRLTFFLKGILPVLSLLSLLLFISMKIIDSVNTSGSSGATDVFMLIGMIILIVGMLFLYWVLLVLIIKRLHDLGRSGWNIFLWLIPLAGQFINLWNWVEFLFVKGTAGPNQFGDRAD